MNRQLKKIIAIVCSLALVVCSMTVYKSTAKAADYSTLTGWKSIGTAQTKDSTTKVDFAYVVLETNDQTMADWITGTNGAGIIEVYNEIYLKIVWHGNYSGAVMSVDGVDCVTGVAGVHVAAAPETHILTNVFFEKDKYYEIKVTSGEKYVTFVLRVGYPDGSEGETETTTEASGEVETTTEASGEQTTDPVEDEDYSTLTYTRVGTTKYFVAAGSDGFPFDTIEDNGNDIKIIPTVAAGSAPIWPNFKDATVNGEAFDQIAGAGIYIPYSLLTEDYNVYQATDTYGTVFKIIIKVDENAEVPTDPAYEDGAVLVNDANVTHNVNKYETGEPYQAEYKKENVKYVQGKKYVAEVVVSSNVEKKIKLVFQNPNGWSFVDAAQGYEYTIPAGSKVKITYVFEATQSVDNGIYDIYLGYPGEAATLVFESNTLTTYTEAPADAVTGVEVLEAPATKKYTVTLDETVTEVEEGSTYKFANDYVINGVPYKAGEVTVTSDITAETLKVELEMTNGASIKLSSPYGMRFMTTVKSTNVDAEYVQYGTLIAADGVIPEVSTEGVVNIKTEYWTDDTQKSYIGAIVNINANNMNRKITGRGYAQIKYANAENEVATVYSNIHIERTFNGVMEAAGLTAEDLIS